MTSRTAFRTKLEERNAEIVRLSKLGVRQSDIARVFGVSVSTVHLAIEAYRDSEEIPIPKWVPERLHHDYETIARQDGEEAAAAYCRRAKRPAVLSLGPCEHGVR